jgi:hypothetical protein
MPSIQIKGVPTQTHAVLRRRARAAHQSLQEYLLEQLIEQASRPTLDEVLDRIAGRSGGSAPLDVVVDLVRADRDRR